MRNKKGSMELGINAIVVLIIALVLLGLGIGFVTRLFTQSSDTFGEIISSSELEFHADTMNPIKFDALQATVKRGSTSPIKVSVYNSGIFPEGSPIKLSITECIDSNDILYSEACDKNRCTYEPAHCNCHLWAIKLAAPAQPIAPGTDGGYRAILSVPKNLYGDLPLESIQQTINDDTITEESERVKAQTYICTIQATDGSVDPQKVTAQLYIKVTI